MRTAITVTAHEIRGGLLSGRFVLAGLVVVSVTLFLLGVALKDQTRREGRYQRLRAAATPSEVIVPPAALAPLAHGLSDHLEREFMFDLVKRGGFITAIGREDAGASLFSSGFAPDLLNCVRVFFSLLALICGAEAVSSERTRGTLRLLLAHPVRRGEMLMGKVGGGLLLAMAPLVLAYLAGIIILFVAGALQPTGGLLARLLVLWLVFLTHQATFYFIGLTLSLVTRRPSDSLAAGVVFWAALVFAAPLCAPVIARWAVPLPSAASLQEARVRTWAATTMAREARNLPEKARQAALSASSSSSDRALQEEYFRRSDRQVATAVKMMCALSPSGCLIDGATAAAGTGPERWKRLRGNLVAHGRHLGGGERVEVLRPPPRQAADDLQAALPGLFALTGWLAFFGLGTLLTGRRLAV